MFKKGLKWSQEIEEKRCKAISIALQGKHCSPKTEFKKGVSHFKGKKCSAYIDGRSLKSNYCIDCGMILAKGAYYFKSKRCKKCWHKFNKGKNHSSYIDGRSNKQYFCINCDKKIYKDTYLYGNKQCNSCAKGGTGIPYENNLYPKEFIKIRKQILKRDNYICQKCSKKGTDIHHIDYNKLNNKKDNLITLCHLCNVKANIDKDYWFAYFKYIIIQIIK